MKSRALTSALKGLFLFIGLTYLSSAHATTNQLTSAIFNSVKGTYTVVCDGKTLYGVTYNQLTEADVCNGEPLPKEVKEPIYIESAYFDYATSFIIVNCSGSDSVFYLKSLKNFKSCEPQNQYKSFARRNAGRVPVDYSSELTVCLLNRLNKIVCKNSFPTLSGYELNDEYQFTSVELVKAAKNGIALQDWVPDTQNQYAPVDSNNPLLQVFNLTAATPDFTDPADEFDYLVTAPGGICAVEIKSKILKCWSTPPYTTKETDPLSFFTTPLFAAKGIDGGKVSQAAPQQYFASAKPVKNFYFMDEEINSTYSTILYVQYTDLSVERFVIQEKGYGDISVLPYPYPASDISTEMIEILQNKGASAATSSQYINDKGDLVFAPEYFENTETPLEKNVYNYYLKGVPVIDYMGSFEYSCFIEKRTAQPACVMISSGAG